MNILNDFFASEAHLERQLHSTRNSEQQRRRLFENVLLLLLGVYLLIDTVNGLFVKTLGLPNLLSAGYKQALFGLMLLFVF